MHSFTLTAIGHLARDPEMLSKDNTLYTRFCLIGNDYGGKDKEGRARSIKTDMYFVAFGGLGETLALHARKGDQLIVVAEVRGNPKSERQPGKPPEFSYIVRDFRFGAPGKIKRDEFNERHRNVEGAQLESSDASPDPEIETPELEIAEEPF